MQDLSELNGVIGTDNTALREAANCLSAYLKIHGGTGRPFEILQYLADSTLQHLDAGKVPHFKNLAIQDAVMGKMGKDASAWLSPLWKKLTTQTLIERAEGLEKFARDKKFNYYPWVGKIESTGGSGNQALYFLEAREVSREGALASQTAKQPNVDITYIPAINLTPSWWARWLFDRNYSASGWRKSLYIWTPVVWILIAGFLSMFLWLILSRSNSPVTTRDLLYIMLSGAMIAYCRHIITRFLRLSDDRIMLAPDNLVGFREFGVCIELARPRNLDKMHPRVLRLVKYASQCPTCNAEVLLDEGEPDFPRRIVGRCQESPREHVFSFDRATRTGIRLR